MDNFIFEEELKNLKNTFYLNDTECLGYTSKELEHTEKEKGFLIPDMLKKMYMMIGKDSNFMSGDKGAYIYEISQIKLINFVWSLKDHIGVEFANYGSKLVLIKNTTYRSPKGADEIRYVTANNQQWSPLCDTNSEIIYKLALNLTSNMTNVLAVKGKNANNTLDLLKKQWDMSEIRSFDTGFDMKILYSVANHLLLIYDDEEKDKIVISSNDDNVISQIKSSYKTKVLKDENGKKTDPKVYCTEQSPETFEDKLNAIYKIYFGVKINPLKKSVPENLPEEIKKFYQLMGSKRKIFESAYDIPKLKDIKIKDGCMVIAEEEQSVCSYVIDIPNNKVYYVSDDERIEEQTTIGDFLIYLLVVQGTGFMNTQAFMEATEEAKKFFNVFKSNNTEIYINQKRGILGFSYDEDQVLLMANKDEVFEKFIDDSGIDLSFE